MVIELIEKEYALKILEMLMILSRIKFKDEQIKALLEIVS